MSVGLGLQDSFGEKWDDTIPTGFGCSFQFDCVLYIALFGENICLAKKRGLPEDLPAGTVEHADELLLVFLFDFE